MIAKTMAAMLVVGLAPLGLFGGIAIQQESARLRSEATAQLETSATWISSQVDEWVDKNVRMLRAAVALPAMEGMRREDQAKVLVSITRAYPWIYLAHTLGLDGRDVARSDDKPLDDFASRQYFKDLTRGGKDLAWEAVIGKTSRKPALVLAVPIRTGGNVVGMIVAAMTIEDVSKQIATWKTGDTGFAFLVDERSKVLAHPRADYVLTQKPIPDHPMIAAFHADQRPHLVSFVDRGKPTLGYVQGTRAGWGVVVQQDEHELYAPLQRMVSLALTILFGAALLVALIAWFSSKTLIRPLLAFAHRNREMVSLLGVMDQGFLSMRPDGTLAAERSAKATELLGGYQPDQRLWQAIAPHDPGFAAWLELGWASVTEGVMPLELTLQQLPGRLTLGDHDYRIEYKPAIVDNTVGDTLIVITDMTAELARARAEATERDLLRMIERTARDRSGSTEFVDEANRLIRRLEDTASEVSKELKRDLHTLKGNCAIYGLTQIAEWCHQLEDGIELTGQLDRNVTTLIVHAWSELKSKLERVFGQLQGAGVHVEPDDVAELCSAIQSGASIGIVEQLVGSWTLERTRPRLDRFAEQIVALGERLGKRNVKVEIADHRLRLDATALRGFWSAFAHAVRNAVDHGLEAPDDRIAAGKPAHGTIRLITQRDATGVTIELGDDGRGIDWDAIRERARAAGLPHASHDDLVAALVTDGITTRSSVSETSGRGVGLAALAEECTRLGGNIEITSTRGQGTQFRFRFEHGPATGGEPRRRAASLPPASRTRSVSKLPFAVARNPAPGTR